VQELVVTVPKKRAKKSDAEDAWALAEQLRVGAIEASVHKPPATLAPLRTAVTGYGCLMRDVVRVRNRLHAIVARSRGLEVQPESIRDPVARRAWLQNLPESHQPLCDMLARELDVLLPLREQAERRMLDEAKHHTIVKRLAKVPGLGPIRSALVAAIVATPYRFRTRRQF
jgi:transposase